MTPKTTKPEVFVSIIVRSRCPQCSNTIERQTNLLAESLTTGNTTERASYHAAALIKYVDSERLGRGWTENMCGRCRDVPPEKRADLEEFKRQQASIQALAAGGRSE